MIGSGQQLVQTIVVIINQDGVKYIISDDFIVTNNPREVCFLSALLYGATGQLIDHAFYWTRSTSYLKYTSSARQCIVENRYFSASAISSTVSIFRVFRNFWSAGGRHERLWGIRKKKTTTTIV